MKYKNTNPFAVYDPNQVDDSEDMDLHWEDFLTNLREEFESQVGKEVHATGEEMGWQRKSGEKTFTLEKTKNVFDEIIPNTQHLSYYIYKMDYNKYVARVFHHDSPMGETYKLTIQEKAI
jgi:hypothetical protein